MSAPNVKPKGEYPGASAPHQEKLAWLRRDLEEKHEAAKNKIDYAAIQRMRDTTCEAIQQGDYSRAGALVAGLLGIRLSTDVVDHMTERIAIIDAEIEKLTHEKLTQ